MAKGVKAAPADELTIGLHDPGMTPLLRAGLGGLAASIRAIGMAADPAFVWPSPVKLGPGVARVEPRRVVLDLGDDAPATLQALFEGSFRIREGLIDLPGSWRQERWSLAVAAALQTGYKRTFLQHGKTTEKDGGVRPKQVEIDDRSLTVTYQPYKGYNHQHAFVKLAGSLKTGSVELASWVGPGAVGRHNAFAETKEWSYSTNEALAAIFAIVGCLSFPVAQSRGAGALVIPEPSDLVRFAALRPRLTPDSVFDAHVAGGSDALLRVNLALRLDDLAQSGTAVAATHAMTLRPTPWAKQQKSRVATVSLGHVPDPVLDAYDVAAKTLPTRILVKQADEDDTDDEDAGYFAVTSALRGFVAENLAAGRRWFAGFATATTSEKQPRWIHRYRTTKDKLGALRAEERKGLIEMTKQLEEAETHLVRSVHVALRQRFGAISKETKDMPAETRRNRIKGEREKWRLAFAGAKTHEQVRAALADLWGRAGPNAELRAHWEDLLPLLRVGQWQAARDLALVALASYQGKGVSGESDEGDDQDEAADAAAPQE